MSALQNHDVDVRSLQSSDDAAAYARFLELSPAATVYHSVPYRDLMLQSTGGRPRYGLAWRGREVIGALPLMFIDGPLGSVANSLPFFGSHGDLLTGDVGAAAALQRWFHDQIRQDNVAAATIISNPFDDAPQARWEDSTLVDERIGQWTPLADESGEPVDLHGAIDGSARRNLAKAQAERVTVEVDNTALEFLAACHRLNMAEIGGRAKPEAFFTALPSVMNAGRDYRIYLARRDGSPIAALLVFLFKNFAEYIMPVTAPGNREYQPTAALILRAMQDAQSEGRRIWNWGGTWTSQTGVYRFKRKWGATEKRYAYYSYVRNRRVLSQTAEALTAGYPYFFVVPFSGLTEVREGV
ncbi:GNAT family N-acetyltransferase [Bradyrhizobium sp. B117]|uniref:GNAT family N-acetyltransferase n=1 Tax=Bradyrhizobium sp. B117 TaxID=3140246 RepID=UPI00318363AC